MTVNIEALERWAECLGHIGPGDNYNMNHWDHCAIGWACREEYFIEHGLRMVNAFPVFVGGSALAAVSRAFGVTDREIGFIIDPLAYPAEKWEGPEAAAESIRRIRVLIDKHKPVAAPVAATTELVDA